MARFANAFDASKDKVIATITVGNIEDYEVVLALMSYDGGKPKIAVMGKSSPDAFGSVRTWPMKRIGPDVMDLIATSWPKFKKQLGKKLMA